MGDTPALHLGTVDRLFRYPVKSLQGREVASLTVDAGGVRGDRARGIVDARGGTVLSAKRHKVLLDAWADERALTLPDGSVIAFDDPAVDEVLSAWLGRPVRLGAPSAEETVAYEMTFDPPDDEAEYFAIPTPTGSFVDLAAVHLVTAATLSGAAAARPDLDWDPRRFRPNLVLGVDGPAFVEQDWLGRHLQVGSVVLQLDQPTVRCAMPLRAQPGGLERQPELFRAMEQLNPTFPNHLGLYASVVTPGEVTVGDPVLLH